jgi:hypothetical protein
VSTKNTQTLDGVFPLHVICLTRLRDPR